MPTLSPKNQCHNMSHGPTHPHPTCICHNISCPTHAHRYIPLLPISLFRDKKLLCLHEGNPILQKEDEELDLFRESLLP